MGLRSHEQNTLNVYVEKALKGGAAYCKVIPASRIATSEWVRLKCQFGCSGYGRRRTCPPLSPTPSTTRLMLRDFSDAIFVVFRVPNAGVERRLRKRGRKLLVALERELFLDGYYSALALGFGPCNLCPACDLNERCKHPELARPSVEACGIDVYATARAAGYPLNVVRTYEEGCSYCGLVLCGGRDHRSLTASRRLPAVSRRPAPLSRRPAVRPRKSARGTKGETE